MPEQNDDLKRCAYRMAGHLVMAEYFGAGGWSVIWLDEVSGKFAATAYYMHTPENLGAIALSGFLAEAIALQDEKTFNDCLSLAASELETDQGIALSITDELRVREVVRSRQYHINAYALDALSQWDAPDNLGEFQMQNTPIKNPEELPEYHRAAYETGAIVSASLIQSADPRLAIPDAARVQKESF